MDIQRITLASIVGFLILLSSSFLLFEFLGYKGIFLLSKSILIIQFMVSVFFLSSFRLIAKSVYGSFINSSSLLKKRVLIYGAGDSGLITKQTILNDRNANVKIEGYLDDNYSLQGKSLEGIQVYNPEKILSNGFIKKNNIKKLIIAIQKIEPVKKKRIIDLCLEQQIEVQEVPPYKSWINGSLSAKQIKNVKIEDLLGRQVIALDNNNIKRELNHKTILVTGGAGSIGSEIVRQILVHSPHKVIVIDQAESAAYDLEIELRQKHPLLTDKLEIVIGDVTNEKHMHSIFDRFRPEIIFHAAAYKHVPLMESNPCECIYTNIIGTRIISDLAKAFGLEKFIMISTDKAINPTNVMGASKRVSEMYTQALNEENSNTQFITTRFGNVLGSNGSVIPLFKKQIDNGGPITITDKNITRYFMTIPEACNLVLEAGAMGNGGEIFVFDMGESIKIYDLAIKMINLSGLNLGKDIEIEEIGLRPGEKLYEELLSSKENTIPTHHAKIMKARVANVDINGLLPQFEKLQDAAVNQKHINAVKILKDLVPEYKSNNSKYSELDQNVDLKIG